MTLRKAILQTHLFVGLISGLVIIVLGVTGCILAFQKEIENATQAYRFVEAENKPFLPPSRLQAIAASYLPGKHLNAVLYERKGKSAQVSFYQYQAPSYNYIVYLNPYNGQLQMVKDMNRDFFRNIVTGHYYLWLPPNIGQPIVAWSTLLFVLMMITGLVLWWPGRQAVAKQRLTIKWRASWKRRNFDLHHVLGFYMTWVAIILAFTGLVWGFQWFARSVYSLAGGGHEINYSLPLSDTSSVDEKSKPVIDALWSKISHQFPSVEMIKLHLPSSITSPIVVNLNPDAATFYKTDYRYFDQYKLSELESESIYGKWKQATAADKLILMNHDIHTGAILGLPGKMLMFFASLIAASLPVTGFYIWWGKRRKSLIATTTRVQ